jgi:hypothetical protein
MTFRGKMADPSKYTCQPFTSPQSTQWLPPGQAPDTPPEQQPAPEHRSDAFIMYKTTNGFTHQTAPFETREACEREAAYLLWKGKLREATCSEAPALAPEHRSDAEAPAVAYTLLDMYTEDKWVSEAGGLTLEQCKALIKEREHYHFRGAHCTPSPPEQGKLKAGEVVQPEPPKAAAPKAAPAKRVAKLRQQHRQFDPIGTVVAFFTPGN